MLVLRRSEGQWVEIVHPASGDRIAVRTYRIEGREPGQSGRVHLAFDDPDRHFEISRPERAIRPGAPESRG